MSEVLSCLTGSLSSLLVLMSSIAIGSAAGRSPTVGLPDSKRVEIEQNARDYLPQTLGSLSNPSKQAFWKIYSPGAWASVRFYALWDTPFPSFSSSGKECHVELLLVEFGNLTPALPSARIIIRSKSDILAFWDPASPDASCLIGPCDGYMGVTEHLKLAGSTSEHARAWLQALKAWGESVEDWRFALLTEKGTGNLLFTRSPFEHLAEKASVASPRLSRVAEVAMLEMPSSWDPVSGVGRLPDGAFAFLETGVGDGRCITAIGAEGVVIRDGSKFMVSLVRDHALCEPWPTFGIEKIPAWLTKLSRSSVLPRIGVGAAWTDDATVRCAALSVMSPRTWKTTFGFAVDPELWAVPRMLP